MEITPDYILTLMSIRNGEIPAPPEIVKEAKDMLNAINEELGKGGW